MYSGKETKNCNQGLDSNIIDHYEQYDLENHLKYFKNSKCINESLNKSYQIVKQPHILDNADFYNTMRQLNKEQARIVKDVLSKKICQPDKPI